MANFKSCNFSDNLEWLLNNKLFDRLVQILWQPDMDLFASRLIYKEEKYVSWGPDPGALAIDAFMLDWSQFDVFYAFPPFSYVGSVIEKALEDRARGILHWPTCSLLGRLMALGLRKFERRPRKNNLLVTGSPDSVPMLNKSPLGAFLLSLLRRV